jgi:predicted lipoprotein with Yx(FWY)xxD motif
MSACGKTISVSDSSKKAPASAPASAPSTAPPANEAGQPAGNSALQVVDSSASANGKSGDGGTVVGTVVQETPPVWVQLSAVDSDKLGTHLTNINQATLYRFDKDTSDPASSNCYADCAAKWPPVTIKEGGNVFLSGVDAKEVGAIRRTDGTVQVTVGGHPLYRFSGDSKPGDANGEGLQGVWFAVGPTGEKSASGQG